MLTFHPANLVTDLTTLQAILIDALVNAPPEVWHRRTGTRDQDWTLHQVVAHLGIVSEVFNAAFDAACAHQPTLIEGFTQRTDLRDWNDREIGRRAEQSRQGLVDDLITALNGAAQRAQSAPDDSHQTHFPIYNRSIRAQDFLAFQLSHAGVIHAAQVVRPLGIPPLWNRYDEALLHRQIERFLLHFSNAYWPEYGDGEQAMNFRIDGAAGGEWHIAGKPEGGSTSVGALADADYDLRFANPDVLFRVFTLETPMMHALNAGDVVIAGAEDHAMRALNFIKLFAAAPPKVA